LPFLPRPAPVLDVATRWAQLHAPNEEKDKMSQRIARRVARVVFPAAFFSAGSVIVAACGGAVADPSESTSTTSQALSGPDAGLITISGNVLDATGFGVVGVTMTLDGTSQAAQITDQAGAFRFTVKPGSYSLTPMVTPGFFPPGFVNCPGFSPNVVNLNNLTASTTVNFLGFGQSIVTDCFPAPNQGATSGAFSISGKVTSGGLPVAGVKVSLNGSTQATRIADETGAYSFSVNPGSYSLTLSQACQSFTPDVVNLNNLKSSVTENFRGSSCPPAPLTLCPELDSLFGIPTPPSCTTATTNDCVGDRLSTWGFAFPLDFLNGNFVDCRFGKWTVPPLSTILTPTQADVWFESVTLFTLQLFGCATANVMTGPLHFDLIPPVFASLKFTTADLAALIDEYMAAIAQGFADFGIPEGLTPAQLAEVQAQIEFAASKVPGVVNSTSLTYSTCAADAGGQ
jgi:hypothetical protein